MLITSFHTATLPKLLQLKIHERIGTEYSQFGTFLLNDEHGTRVPSICAAGNPVVNILREWLLGRGQPIMWESLVQALENANFRALAREVHLKMIS